MLSDIDQKIFKQIVQSNKFISSQSLSTICNISINTVRKAVDNLNFFLIDKGCYIDSKISSGYRLEITDNDVAIPFIQQFLADFERFNYLDVNNLSSAYIILSKLLIANDYLTVDKLMNNMYCSKSTVFRIMDNVKLIAESYYLELKNKRNYGFYIEGNEWSIRNCLNFLEKVNHHSSNNFNNFNSLEFELLNNKEIKLSIRTSIITAINQSSPHLHIPNLNMHKIFDYIIFSHTRRKHLSNLGFSPQMIQTARQLPTYQTARKIYEFLPDRFRNDVNELDYISLSALLACCMIIQDPQTIPKEQLDIIKEETEEMIDFICKYFDIRDCFNEQFKHNFYCYYYSLNLKKTFNFVSDMEGVFPSIRLGLMSSDVCSLFALYYKIKHQITLKETDLINAYYIFNLASYNNNLIHSFNHISAAISARNGYFEAINLQARILKLYPNNFTKLDAIEHTDIFSEKMKMYDLLIINYNLKPQISPPIHINNIIKIGNIHDDNTFGNLAEYFRNQVITEAKTLLTEENIIHTSFKNKEEVYEAIYQRHQDEVENKEGFINDLRLRDNFVSFEKTNSIVMICPLAYKTEKAYLDIYISDNPVVWKQNKDIIFIFYSRGSGSRHEIMIISYLLKQFLYQHPYFINTMYRKTYREIIRSLQF